MQMPGLNRWGATLLVGAIGCAAVSCSTTSEGLGGACRGKCPVATPDAGGDTQAHVPAEPRFDAARDSDSVGVADAPGPFDAAGVNLHNVGAECRRDSLSCEPGQDCYRPLFSAGFQIYPSVCYPIGMPPCQLGPLTTCPSQFYEGTIDETATCCAPLAGTDIFACQNPARDKAYCTCPGPEVWSELGTAHSCVSQDCPEKYTGDAPSAVAMASDGVTLFLSLVEASTIVGLPIGGAQHVEGTPLPILASNQSYVYSLVFDGGYLYWPNNAGIAKRPAAGGTPTQLAGIGPGPEQIALSGDYMYWTAKATVSKRLLTGGPTVQLSTTSTRMAVGGAGVLLSELDRIALYPADGGPSRTIVTSDGYNAVTLDDTNAYWADDETRGCGIVTTIYKAPLAGGPVTVLAQARDSATMLYAHGTSIYWPGRAGIFTMPRDGGAPRMIVEALRVNAMTISGNSLYWSDFANIYKSDL